MKEIVAHSIVASLSDKEKKRLRLSLSRMRDGDALVGFLDLLMGSSKGKGLGRPGRVAVSRRLRIRFGKRLLLFLAGEHAHLRLAALLGPATRLVARRDYAGAAAVVEWGLQLAEEGEDYRMVDALWHVLEGCPAPRPEVKGMGQAHALACIANEVAYQQLELTLRHNRSEEDAAHRQSVIAEVSGSPLLQSPGMALTKRARRSFWKLRAGCLYFAGRYGEAIAPQGSLVALLEIDAELHPLNAHEYLREMGTLASLYAQTRKLVQAENVLGQIADFPAVVARIDEEKLMQLYPLRLGVAIEMGNAQAGKECCNFLLTLFDHEAGLCPEGFQGENLYYMAYFQIAAGQPEAAAKLLVRLRGLEKGLRPRVCALYRLLEVVLELERGDWEDALRLVKNLRVSRHPREVPGMALALQLLGMVAGMWMAPGARWDTVACDAGVLALLAQLKGQPVLNYLDLGALLDAKATGRIMLELAQARRD